MRVENTNPLPYSLKMADGSYEVIGAKSTLEDVDVHPDLLETYRNAGFVIDGEGSKTPKKSPETAATDLSGGSMPTDGQSAVLVQNLGASQQTISDEGDDEGDDEGGADEQTQSEGETSDEDTTPGQEKKPEAAPKVKPGRRNRRR